MTDKDKGQRKPQKITKRSIDALKPGGFLWDGSIKGFGVRCQRRDKVYFLKYRIHGKQRWHIIGKHGSPWTIDKARKRADKLLGLIADGIDPAKVRDLEKNKPTVAELCTRYLEEYAEEHKKPSSVRMDRKNIDNHVLPVLGKEFVDAVTQTDIDRFKKAVKDGTTARKRKPEQQGGPGVTGGPGAANRCLALVSKMFNLAERWDLRPINSNPCRHIDRYPERGHERFLSEVELSALAETLNELEDSDYVVAAIRLLLFTGARLGEILSLKWEHVDLERALLALPDSKTGKKAIYLSAPALDVLANLPRIKGNLFVICGNKDGAALVNLQKPWGRIRKQATLKLWDKDAGIAAVISELTKDGKAPALEAVIAEATKRELTVPRDLTDVRLHDLRHSFASMGAGGGLSLPMIGKLLGHTQAVTTARYAHLADDPLRAANEAIGEKIAAAMKGESGEVVNMPNRKA